MLAFALAAAILVLMASVPVRSQTTAYVSSVPTEVYGETHRGFEVVAELSYREIVEVLQQHKEWARIRFADDREGWVRQADLSLSKPSVFADLHEQVFDPIIKWFDPQYPVVSWRSAEPYRGWFRTVQGTVRKVVAAPNYYYLEFDSSGKGFRAVISHLDADNFPYPLETFYLFREVRVSGLIKTGPGGAEIALLDPSQIERAYIPR